MAALGLKLKALAAHQSQMQNMNDGDFDVEARIRDWARSAAKDEPFEYGERFRTFEIEV